MRGGASRPVTVAALLRWLLKYIVVAWLVALLAILVAGLFKRKVERNVQESVEAFGHWRGVGLGDGEKHCMDSASPLCRSRVLLFLQSRCKAGLLSSPVLLIGAPTLERGGSIKRRNL